MGVRGWFAFGFVLAVTTSCAVQTGADGVPYCWIYDCPSDPGSDVCGTCVHPGWDSECTPGFVCSCSAICVKGPRSFDGGVCLSDAGPADPGASDARLYDWPVCDDHHLPGQ
jgi:hypothetical protein